MWLTDRDVRLLNDMALSHLLSRDQIIRLRHFGSVTRANTRIRQLAKHGLIRRLETPFFQQSLYVLGRGAYDLVKPRLRSLVMNRAASPRFLQHALSVTNTRIRLLEIGARAWRFEQQLRTTFAAGGKEFEVRPDGLALFEPGRVLALEVDLGHVSRDKYRRKLEAYHAFVASGTCGKAWPAPSFRLLTLCPSGERSRRLAALTPPNCQFEHLVETFTKFGVASVGAWS